MVPKGFVEEPEKENGAKRTDGETAQEAVVSLQYSEDSVLVHHKPHGICPGKEPYLSPAEKNVGNMPFLFFLFSFGYKKIQDFYEGSRISFYWT